MVSVNPKSVFSFLAAFLVALPGFAWEAAVVPATRKVVPTAAAGYATYPSASLEGCRNEWESFQIVIRESGTVAGVDVVMSELSDGAGHTIPASAFVLYREWFLNVTEPSGGGYAVSNHERNPGLYPDPLIPFEDPWKPERVPVAAPFSLTESDPGLAVVFVDLHIPADAVPTTYSGTATVTATGRQPIVLPVSLSVWEIDMPDQRNVSTSYSLSEGPIRSYHGGKLADSTSEEYPQIVRNYYKAIHDNRIDPGEVKGPVSFEFDEGGVLKPVDWTAYDAAVGPWIDGSYFGDGIGVASFDAAMFSPGHGTGSMTDDQYRAAAKAYAEHLYEKGWLDKMWVYSTDEPWLNGGDETWQRVIREAGLLHSATSPDLWEGKVLVTGPMYPGAEDVVDIWCPVNPMYDKWFWFDMNYAGRGGYDEHLASGKNQLWFYNCNGNFPPYPGYDIDTTIGYEPRILKWGAFYERASGFLHWRLNIWYYVEPWTKWQSIDVFGAVFARNGDGMLMYPGDSDGTLETPGTPPWLHIDGPVLSYRIKQIRDGLEDWEMFILAEKAGIGDWVRQELSKAYVRFGDFMTEDCTQDYYYCPQREPWTLDENVLLEVRHRIAMKLLYTMYPDRYEDPDAPVVSDDVPEVSDQASPPELVDSAETIESDAVSPADIRDSGADSAAADSGTGNDEGTNADTGATSPSGGCSSTGDRSSTAGLFMIFGLCAVVMLGRYSRRSRT